MEKTLQLKKEMEELKIGILEREIMILKLEKEQISGRFLIECERLLDEEIKRKLIEIEAMKADVKAEDDETVRFIFEY